MSALDVVTLGCRLNLAEGERLHGLLAGGQAAQGAATGSGLIVVNSCAVTAQASRSTRQAIRRAARARPDARLLVTGCGAEIEREALLAMPQVHGLVANARKLDPAAWGLPPTAVAAMPLRTRAFVPVQDGCDHACTFCVIPQGRGTSRSHPVVAVLRAVERHLDAGAREVVLTGVDLTAWGADLPDTPRLGALVTAILAAFPQLPRLRLSSLDGVEIDPVLFDLLADEARVMPHVHLSLQSGDDLVLKRMRRRHTRSEAVALVARLRARRPQVAIGADLIAGFPTESEAMHAANLSLVADLAIVHGHVFPYSPRSGTPAARMPQVPAATIKTRAAALRDAIAGEHARWQAAQVGRRLDILAERDGTGRAGNFARVRLPTGTPAGTLVSLTPTHVADGMLVAENIAVVQDMAA